MASKAFETIGGRELTSEEAIGLKLWWMFRA